MIPIIFNVKNSFNMKCKNHGIKPINIFTIKSRITMTLSIQENISQPYPNDDLQFLSISPSVVETKTLVLTITFALLLFDEMR